MTVTNQKHLLFMTVLLGVIFTLSTAQQKLNLRGLSSSDSSSSDSSSSDSYISDSSSSESSISDSSISDSSYTDINATALNLIHPFSRVRYGLDQLDWDPIKMDAAVRKYWNTDMNFIYHYIDHNGTNVTYSAPPAITLPPGCL